MNPLRKSKIGILGGGQLGRMLALAGYPLDISCRFLEPADESSASAVGERIRGSYDDIDVLNQFAQGLDAVTFEFENVPIDSARRLADRVPVWPPPSALAIAQDRIVEKEFLQSIDIPVTSFGLISAEADFESVLKQIELPAVLKTRRLGYDGKGQMLLRVEQDTGVAWRTLGERPLIIERFVPFVRELSLIAVRSQTGWIVYYPLVENHHRDGILRTTSAPAANVSSNLQQRAENVAQRIMESLQYVGALAIEFFDTGEELLVNEIAPRVHNSGHWTIEGSETSQFENHLRAVCNLPLGSTQTIGHSIMFNLIGALPDVHETLSVPGAHLHLYGKMPRPKRKIGHVTLQCMNSLELKERADRLAALIG